MTVTYSATSVNLGGNFLPADGYKPERWQSMATTGGGAPVIYDRGVLVHWIPIHARLTKATLLLLRSFFNTTVQWAKTDFTFTPDAGWDVGNGAGTMTVRLWQNSYSERMITDNLYEVKLLLRAYSTP